eukprot:gnl/MRDRNA2_/MRDRNA2_27666_c0_seq1.p1 gnl/MRDRNA2_/MRDRNA2_27666_c0~~gnl/MRDRNA2_/MRDRNA2_27666_c0_seq1.p1  ORF type:complete len:1022 (+),score=266.46 gnl/MRDRNA2_/MRDRNA2_27666_c0_seq1:47-3112(+)
MSKADHKDKVKKKFQALDANGDGVISKEEFSFVMTAVGYQGSIDELLTQADCDGDGVISYEEFVEWIFTDAPADKASEQPERLVSGFQKRQEMHAKMAKVQKELDALEEDLTKVDFDRDSTKESKMKLKNAIRFKRREVARLEVSIAGHNVVEMQFPPGHKLFKVGGKAGDIVVKAMGGQDSKALVLCDVAEDIYLGIQQGWKIVSCDGIKLPGPEAMRCASLSHQAGRICSIGFEVDEHTMQVLGREILKQTKARLDLNEALGNRSLEQLGDLTSQEKHAFLQKSNIASLMVAACDVFQLQALLGVKSGKELQAGRDLFSAAQHGDLAALRRLADDPEVDCLQRDSYGNLPLHHVASLECAQFLVEQEPKSIGIKNKLGQTPMQAYVIRRPQQSEASALLKTFRESVDQFLLFDEQGVSAAMRTGGLTRTGIAAMLPCWADIQAALAKEDITEILPALERLSIHWQEVIAFHCFGEPIIWQDGFHTELSEAHLKEVWKTLKMVFVEAREEKQKHAPDILRKLLQATRGPFSNHFDPRLPYREELMFAAWRLQETSATALHGIYEGLTGEAAEWAKNAEDVLTEEVKQDEFLTKVCIEPEKLWGKGLHFGVTPPSWLAEPDLTQVMADLRQVGMVGAFDGHSDVYEMLQLADNQFQQHGLSASFIISEQDCVIARWFAAWLRGVCQQHQDSVARAVQELLGSAVVPGENFFSRTEAKGFKRICERLQEIFQEFLEMLKEVPTDVNVATMDFKMLMQQAAAFITDINGCTFIASTIDDAQAAFSRLTNSKAKLQRTKNGFLGSRNSASGYRDMKLFVELPGEHRLLVEVQIILRSYFNEKHFMHLPYELFRGSLDWSHLSSLIGKYKDKWEKFNQVPMSEVRKAGYCAWQLKELEYSIAALKEAGYTASELLQCYTAEQLQEVGYTAVEMKEAGLKKDEILAIQGWECADLKQIGCTAKELTERNHALPYLKGAGYTAADLKAAGCDWGSLKEVGYTFKQVKLAYPNITKKVWDDYQEEEEE